MIAAVAAAAGVPEASVRRAQTLAGDLGAVAVAALGSGEAGLAGFGLTVGVPLAPMLAGSAPTVAEALERTGPAGVEWKLDGIRVQLHRLGEQVRVFTRSLDEVTDRMPEVVTAVLAGVPDSSVLDGEVLALRPDGRPRPFQETASRTGTRSDPAAGAVATPLTVFVFDALHLAGRDVLDQPGALRRNALRDHVEPSLLVPRLDVTDPGGPGRSWPGPRPSPPTRSLAGTRASWSSRDASPYAMGRRGVGWVKVKPVHTLDLVVLAAEWGHGRRTGRLSNLHLGALDPDGRFGPAGGFVMLGKTFKGLTDAMLAWQTERLPELAEGRTEAGWCGSGPSWSWRSPSTACRPRRATRPRWRCGSPGWCATGRTSGRRTRTPSKRSRRCVRHRRDDLTACRGCRTVEDVAMSRSSHRRTTARRDH